MFSNSDVENCISKFYFICVKVFKNNLFLELVFHLEIHSRPKMMIKLLFKTIGNVSFASNFKNLYNLQKLEMLCGKYKYLFNF